MTLVNIYDVQKMQVVYSRKKIERLQASVSPDFLAIFETVLRNSFFLLEKHCCESFLVESLTKKFVLLAHLLEIFCQV